MQTLESYPQYECTRILKQTDNKKVRVFRNTELDQYVVERILYHAKATSYELLSGILHPNLLEIYEVDFWEGNTYILEEYFDGISLSEFLKDRLMTFKETKHIMLSLCNALEALHGNGIIHRDIKPQNVMVNEQNKVKLIDYDISKIYHSSVQQDTEVLGTLGFAAPEQYGIAQSNERTDIYALGVLMNLLLTGEHPSVRLCTGRMRRIVRKCVITENSGRYKNVLELKKALLLC